MPGVCCAVLFAALSQTRTAVSGGGSPVRGTIISQNVIVNEDEDIAVNTPAELDAHLNELLGGNTGIANVCALDDTACTGSIEATENYWGCRAGPRR
ncbi:MAG: hypothetical protein ABSF15_12515 [Candidatus Sulfotelmatobacter sp.]|jgi:hypothetical protein